MVTYDVDWIDATRNRHVPARIYAPADLTSTAPVIVFSHGLGNSKEGYSYLGEHWASHGYVSIHPDHPGADVEVTRHGLWHLYLAGFDRAFWTTLPEDDHFVIDQVVRGNLPEALRGHVDTTRIGVAGHRSPIHRAASAVSASRPTMPDLPAWMAILIGVPKRRSHASIARWLDSAYFQAMSGRFDPYSIGTS